MIFRYNNTEYTFPSRLSEITLGQRIEFHEQHGKFLDELAAKLDKIEDEFDKEAETNIWHIELAVRTFSFYTGIKLEMIQERVDIAAMLAIYNTDIHPLIEEEKAITVLQSYEFSGEQWVISAPELLATNKMVFNEFIHAKEIVRQLHQVGKGKWHALPYLCAIYLRKADEPFDESFTIDGGERMELMKTLPLDIALGVGFFLSSTLSIYSTISPSSERVNQKESIQPVISTGGDG